MRTLSTLTKTVATCALLVAPAAAGAVTINFETGYTDNQVINSGDALLDDTGAVTGVTVTTTPGHTMSIEASGMDSTDTVDGFVNDPIPRSEGNRDIESDIETERLGAFFLRATDGLSGDFLTFNPVFSLNFAGGASEVSAQIWDIDGNTRQGSEAWRLIATFAGGATQEILSPEYSTNDDDNSLNGQDWSFSFSSMANDIMRIDFLFVGTKREGIGVAFDNLSVSQVPLPAGAVLLLSALGAGAFMRRRRTAV